MIKAIIVDDESSAIKSLKWEIEKFCRGIEVINFYTDPRKAIEGINLLQPDCVFLDIEMPEMDGFQLLRHLNFRDFELVFTTAYDNYAIKAFKQDALDYLLKPIDSDDLVVAVEKIKQKKERNSLGDELKKVLAQMRKDGLHKIPLSFSSKTIYVEPEDIIYCKSDGNYTEVNLKNGKKEVLSKKLKDVEILIDETTFLRVHNSFLVNMKYLKEFVKTDGSYLVLENGASIPVSRTKKADLLHFLNGEF